MGSRNSNRGGARGTVRVRRARQADLAALNHLYRELHLDDYDEFAPTSAKFRSAFRSVARDRDHHLLVAEQGGRVVGTVHLLIFRHLGHGLRPVAIVENVVVQSGLRSKGIGELMIEAARAIARTNGCYKMSLTSNIRRPRAHRFYEHLGWRRTHLGFSFDLD
jgi:GNAT superfamily N-acetyltransferase